MKIVAITGSPRENGRTSAIVNEIVKGFTEDGGQSELFHINDLDIKGCQACGYCDSHDGCAVKDDMQDIYSAIEEADAVVIGSPVYMYQMTAQTKMVMDRFNRYLNSSDFTHKLGEGKRTSLVFTQNSSNEESFRSYFDQTSSALSMLGFNIGDVLVSGGSNGALNQDLENSTKQKAYNMGIALRSEK